MEIYRIAAYFKIWDVEGPNGWLSRISWEQLWRWIRFRRIEPQGEEREDLRIGALASVIYNMNMDTRKTGVIKSYRYVTGWGSDKVHMLALEPNAEDTKAASQSSGPGYGSDSGSGPDRTLNNPTVWENFKAGLKKVYGSRKAGG